MSDALQTDYDEMFDMRYRSVLYAGLKLNEQERTAEALEEKDVRILRPSDLESPDLSRVVRLEDLEKIGLKDIGHARVKMARMQNGKLRLVVNARSLARTASNRDVTLTINDLCLPYRRNEGEDGNKNRRWQPPNAEWRNLFEVLMVNGTGRRLIDRVEKTRLGSNCIFDRKFDDPCQGAASNSWFVAALFSVFWSDPAAINRRTRLGRRPHKKDDDEEEHERTLKIRFHDKGGRNNAETATIDVDYEVPINCTSNEPIYCRSSDGIEIWPALYEKAYARWIEGDRNKSKHGRNASEDRPDLTQMHHGDPIKAMAQINNKEPQYYFCDNHPASDLVAVVRNSCVNYKTINPMCAFTHATGTERAAYRGANLVANHAYSVLGWASEGTRQYIVLRNPWGVTEPRGLSSYGGLIDRVDEDLWPPACLCDHEGVIALDARSFKKHFRCLGVAK